MEIAKWQKGRQEKSREKIEKSGEKAESHRRKRGMRERKYFLVVIFDVR